ncbi:MAG: hypothetical protein IPN74_02200 [Haliscomenobacter sp.]|nr:hypothetical protein [Haliscomenobacter sp.]
MTFNKSETRFPSKAHHIYLAHCGISPLYAPAAKRASELLTEQSLHGGGHFMDFYNPELDGFKEQAALLLQTSADHIAAVRNTGPGGIHGPSPFQPRRRDYHVHP